RRSQGPRQRDRDRHAARFERPGRVESFIFDVEGVDLQARDAAPGTDAFESVDGCSSLTARSNFNGLQREERRVAPEIFPRQQVVGPDVLPIVSGEQRGSAIAGVQQPDRMVLRTRGAFEEYGAHAAVISTGPLRFVPRWLYPRCRIRQS